MSFNGQFILSSGNSFFLSQAGGYRGFVWGGALRGGGGLDFFFHGFLADVGAGVILAAGLWTSV